MVYWLQAFSCRDYYSPLAPAYFCDVAPDSSLQMEVTRKNSLPVFPGCHQPNCYTCISDRTIPSNAAWRCPNYWVTS